MSDFVVQNYGAENKTNMFNSALLGGLTGFAFKYAMPLTEKEKAAYNYDKYMEVADSFVGTELKKFRRAIAKDASAGDKACDIFIHGLNGKTECEAVFRTKPFKSASTVIQAGVKKLASQYNTLREQGLESIQSLFSREVKANRSTNLFVGIGALTGIALGLAKEVLDNRGKQLEENQRQLEDVVI